MEFDFHATKSMIVNEVVFVFTNARVGEAKKGMLEFRNINLIPLPEIAAPDPRDAALTAAVSATQLSVSQPVPSPVAPQASVPAADSSFSVSKKASPE